MEVNDCRNCAYFKVGASLKVEAGDIDPTLTLDFKGGGSSKVEGGDVDPTLTLDFKGGASSKVDGGDVEPTNTKSGWGIVISLQL